MFKTKLSLVVLVYVATLCQVSWSLLLKEDNHGVRKLTSRQTDFCSNNEQHLLLVTS